MALYKTAEIFPPFFVFYSLVDSVSVTEIPRKISPSISFSMGMAFLRKPL